MSTKLYIVRHGESDGNKQDLYAGFSNVAITELGIRQARATAEYLKKTTELDAVYSSDLSRALTTARITADLFGLEVIPDESLRELYGGEWEMKSFNGVIPTEYPEDYAVWKDCFEKSRPTGGESVEELRDRIVASVMRIAKANDDKRVAIFTHATPVRILGCVTAGKDLSHIKDLEWVANASVTEITVDGDDATLDVLGYDKHLSGMLTRLSKQI